MLSSPLPRKAPRAPSLPDSPRCRWVPAHGQDTFCDLAQFGSDGAERLGVDVGSYSQTEIFPQCGHTLMIDEEVHPISVRGACVRRATKRQI